MNAEARAVDPSLVALLVVDQLGLVAAPLAPAQVHADSIYAQSLRVVAALSRVDADDRARVVHGPREHARDLGVAKPGVDAGTCAGRLGHRRLVVLGGFSLGGQARQDGSAEVPGIVSEAGHRGRAGLALHRRHRRSPRPTGLGARPAGPAGRPGRARTPDPRPCGVGRRPGAVGAGGRPALTWPGSPRTPSTPSSPGYRKSWVVVAHGDVGAESTERMGKVDVDADGGAVVGADRGPGRRRAIRHRVTEPPEHRRGPRSSCSTPESWTMWAQPGCGSTSPAGGRPGGVRALRST